MLHFLLLHAIHMALVMMVLFERGRSLEVLVVVQDGYFIAADDQFDPDPDPYVIIEVLDSENKTIPGQKEQTERINNVHYARWDESFVFKDLPEDGSFRFRFQAYDHDMFTSHDYLGQVITEPWTELAKEPGNIIDQKRFLEDQESWLHYYFKKPDPPANSPPDSNDSNTNETAQANYMRKKRTRKDKLIKERNSSAEKNRKKNKRKRKKQSKKKEEKKSKSSRLIFRW